MSKKSLDGVSIFSRAVRDVAEQEEAVEAAMESARTSGEAEAAKAGEKEGKMKEIDTNFLPKEELKVRFFSRLRNTLTQPSHFLTSGLLRMCCFE